MNQRKEQFQKNFSKFKEECDRTVDILGKLCNLNFESVRSLEEKEENWLLTHPNYLLDENTFQNLLHHKLFAINLDLEAFYTFIKDTEKSKTRECDYLACSSSICATCKCKYLGTIKQKSSPTTTISDTKDYESIPSYNLPLETDAKNTKNTCGDAVKFHVYNMMDLSPNSVPIETVKEYVNQVQQKVHQSKNNTSETNKNNQTENISLNPLNKEDILALERMECDNTTDFTKNRLRKLLDKEFNKSIESMPSIEIQTSIKVEKDISTESVKEFADQDISQSIAEIDTDALNDSSTSLNINDNCFEERKESQDDQFSIVIDSTKKIGKKIEDTSLICQELENCDSGKGRSIKDTKSNIVDEDKNKLSKMCKKQFPITNKVLAEPKPPKTGNYCMITHFISPSHFYIQIGDENIVNFTEMEEKLKNYCDNSEELNFSSKKEIQELIGKYCVCYSNEYNGYYRAEIIDWLKPESKKVVVKLVDCGNIEFVSVKTIRILEDSFYDIPKSAVRCHFESLYPMGSTIHNKFKYWPEETKKILLEKCGDLQSTVFQIYIFNNENSNSVGLDLVKINEEEVTLGEFLIEKGLAVEISDNYNNYVIKDNFMREQIKNAQGLSGIEVNMEEHEVLDRFFENDNIVEYNNVNEAVMDYNPQDEARTCPFQNKDGTCFKGSRCKLRHTVLPRDGFTADKEPVYNCAFCELDLPAPDSTIDVKITAVINFQRFYVQFIQNCHSIKNLYDNMNDKHMIQKYKKFKGIPCIGEIVIVYWGKLWFRAKVLDISFDQKEKCSLNVFLVDTGDKVKVDFENVRKIIPEFLDLPFQAVEVSFHNITFNKLNLEKEKEHFEYEYLFETFVARIVNCNFGSLEVLLFDKKGDDIGGKLVEAGYGQFKDKSFFPSSKNKLLID